MKKPKAPINWLAVFEAVKRSKLGRSQHGDDKLFAAALKADPVKYGEVSDRARKEAVGEAFPFVPVQVTEQKDVQPEDPHAVISAMAFGKTK